MTDQPASPGEFDLLIWNVGHGLSCSILTPYVFMAGGQLIMRRRHIQFDAGYNKSSDALFSPLQHLYGHGHKAIDNLIISHPDDDHIDDLPNKHDDHVIHSFTCNWTFPHTEISDNPMIEHAPKKHFRHYYGNYNNFVLPDWKILTPMNFGGVETFTTCLPHVPNGERNDSSLISSIVFGNAQILLTGDISAASFKRLHDLGRLPAARTDCYRFLVASHHGRASAEPAFMLGWFKPHLVMASAADEDPYTTSAYSTDRVAGYFINNNFQSARKFVSTKGSKGILLKHQTNWRFPTVSTFSW